MHPGGDSRPEPPDPPAVDTGFSAAKRDAQQANRDHKPRGRRQQSSDRRRLGCDRPVRSEERKRSGLPGQSLLKAEGRAKASRG